MYNYSTCLLIRNKYSGEFHLEGSEVFQTLEDLVEAYRNMFLHIHKRVNDIND
jgi:hypothetical protein